MERRTSVNALVKDVARLIQEIRGLRADLVRADARWRDWESAHQAQKERADYLETVLAGKSDG